MNIVIGQYVPGHSPIHRLDPRSKLVLILIFIIVIFLANNWLTYALITAYTLIFVLLSQVSFRFIYRGLRPILLIILFTFLLNIFFIKTGTLLFHYGWLKVYSGGLIQGAFIVLRLMMIIMMTTMLTLTTTPIDITDGLESLLQPFKKMKLPVHEFALMMSISLRFIPTLMEETEKIMKAQTARGVEFSSGSIVNRVKAIIPLLVPLFVSAFKRAEDLALAMEARGYRGGEGRTKLRKLEWKIGDTVSLVCVVLLTIALFFLRS